MAETYTAGVATISLEQRRVVELLDRTLDGAATGFLREADAALDDVQRAAVARWPVASGHSQRAFERTASVLPDRLEVALLNTARDKRGRPYPRFLRFSMFSTATVQADLQAREDFAARGKTPEARASLRDHYDNTQRLTTSEGEDDPQLQGRPAWSRLVRAPGRRRAQTLIEAVREDLARLAGGG